MYRIQASASCQFTLSGAPATDVEVNIAHGCNWFGYPGTESLSLDDLNISPTTGDKVVSQDGGFAVYNGTAWKGTLTSLQPGKGYVYVSAASLNKTMSFEYPGVEGAARMAELMSGLRTDSPREIAGLGVENVVDYASGIGDLPAANVVEFCLEGGNKVIVRPSGTEPKIKVYLFAKRPTRELAAELLAALAEAAHAMLG